MRHFSLLFLPLLLSAEVTIRTVSGSGSVTTEVSGTRTAIGVSYPSQLPAVHPIERPGHRPIIRNNYYVNNVTIDPEVYCRSYIDMIDERDAYIRDLESKLAAIQLQLQNLQSKYNKLTYDREMNQVTGKKPSLKTKSRIIISNDPQK